MLLSTAKASDASIDSVVIKLNPTLVSACKKLKSLSPSRRQCWTQREKDHVIIIFTLFTVFSTQSIFWIFSGGRSWMCAYVSPFIEKNLIHWDGAEVIFKNK